MVRFQPSLRLWHHLALVLGVGIVLAGAAVPARAEVIYTTGGNPPTFDSSFAEVQGSAVGGVASAFAEAFTPSGNFLFSSVTAPFFVSTGTPQITLSLTSDSGGHPGAVIESFTVTGITATPQNFTENSVTHPLLVSGTQYWITAFPGAADTSGGWNEAFPSPVGTDAFSTDQGVTWTVLAGDQPIEALVVSGDPFVPPAVIPEPSTLALLGTSLGGLMGGAWWRRRTRAA